MSVRERPVANRFLDMKEKELKYKTHLHLVRTCKPCIDMTQPETPRRLLLMQRNQEDYRRRVKETNKVHDRMIRDIQRPHTAFSYGDKDSTTYPKLYGEKSLASTSELNMFRKEYARSASRTPATEAKTSSIYSFAVDAPPKQSPPRKEQEYIPPTIDSEQDHINIGSSTDVEDTIMKAVLSLGENAHRMDPNRSQNAPKSE